MYTLAEESIAHTYFASSYRKFYIPQIGWYVNVTKQGIWADEIYKNIYTYGEYEDVELISGEMVKPIVELLTGINIDTLREVADDC